MTETYVLDTRVGQESAAHICGTCCGQPKLQHNCKVQGMLAHLWLQKRLLIGTTAAGAGVVAAYHNDLTQLHFDTFSALGPFLRLLDSETSHDVGMWTAGHGILPRDRRPDSPSLALSVWGREFPNPIGTCTPAMQFCSSRPAAGAANKDSPALQV